MNKIIRLIRRHIYAAIPTCTLWRKVDKHPEFASKASGGMSLYWEWQFLWFPKTRISPIAADMIARNACRG